MRFRLSLWVSACWFCILASCVLELALLLIALSQLSALAGQTSGIAEMFAQNFTIILFLGWLSGAKMRERYLAEIQAQQGDAIVARRLSFIEKLLTELCRKRDHPLPEVLFIRSGRANDRIMVGMMDNFFVRDVLCLHPDIVGILTEAQMRAVLAHELRHSNALENFLSRLCKLFLGAFFFTAVWLALTSVFNGTSWFSPLLAVLIIVLFLASSFFLRNFRSRFTEYKTDALSTLESEDAESLITALAMVWRVLSVEFNFLEGKQDAWWIGVFNTHPSNESRARALRWIHR